MTEIRGRKKKYPVGEKIKKYPVDSQLIRRVGNFGTANDTLVIALQKALAAAQAGAAAGAKSRVGNDEREAVFFNVTESVADEVLAVVEQITGKKMKFETSLQVIVDLAEQARQAGSA